MSSSGRGGAAQTLGGARLAARGWQPSLLQLARRAAGGSSSSGGGGAVSDALRRLRQLVGAARGARPGRRGSSAAAVAGGVAQRLPATWQRPHERPLLPLPALPADLEKLGVHREYANGAPRPLMRGWVQLLAVLVVEVLLATVPLPGRAADLLRWSSAGFYGSVLFHMVPWRTMPAYSLALFADFLGISASLTGQVGVWLGFSSWPALLSLGLTLAKATLSVMGLMQREVPLWEYRRITRRNIVIAQFFLTSAVEAAIQNKGLVALIGALKWSGLYLYLMHGRHDAPKGPTPATVPGVWEDHDGFHVIVLLGLAVQTYAAMIA